MSTNLFATLGIIHETLIRDGRLEEATWLEQAIERHQRDLRLLMARARTAEAGIGPHSQWYTADGEVSPPRR